MSEQVLIVSTELDVATDAVVRELRRRGQPCVRVNSDRYPYEIGATIELSRAGALAISIEGRPITPRAVWYRRIRSAPQPAGMDPGIHAYCLHEAQTLLRGVSLVGAKRVMSDPAAVFRAENKVAQLAAAAVVGLRIPDTCISNDPMRVASFANKHERIVCKPLRSGWFRDSEGEWSIYTTEVKRDMLDEIDSVSAAPSIFQELIPKHCDVRVTVVGERMFVAEIDSQSDERGKIDWRRTSNSHLPHAAATLPKRVHEKLSALMKRLRLRFGAIDLVRTPADEYVFLEVNPNGQWLWIDDILGLGITEAIVDWLCGSDNAAYDA